MPTKLKNLKLTSVSLVNQGANQRAEIDLKKRKDPDATKEGFLKRLLDFVKKSGYKQEDVEAELDDIEKRYGSDDQPATVEETKPEEVGKSLVAIPSEDPKNQPNNVYKDLSPEVQKEIEELKKYKKAAEDRELHDVAKRYEILGKKDEDLFPVLKFLKAASKDAYDQFIAGLDSAKESVEKSGIFDEIGKSGTGTMPSTSIAKSQAEGKIDNIAKGYIEKGPC